MTDKQPDWNDAVAGGDDPRAAADQAWGSAQTVAAGDEPLPLFPTLPAAEPYPLDALGPVLSKAAKAIANKVQAPAEMAAQSVLAVASLAAQTHVDVRLPYGQARPTSLYFATVAASGDRKSTADNEALIPVRRYEKALTLKYKREVEDYLITHRAWTGEKRKIESDKKLDFHGRVAALAALGPEPNRPLHPFLVAPEPTVEGLQKCWTDAPPALGIFTAEGGQFVGGYAMSSEQRLKTAAAFSGMWDGASQKRLRANDGVTILHGRRLAMHLMIQPDAASHFFSDPTLRDQGLLSRVLVVAPPTMAGSRPYRATAANDQREIDYYADRLEYLFERPWPLAVGTRNELTPKVLTMTPEAEVAWRDLHDEIEHRMGGSGDLHSIRDVAAKAAENAARIAGVIAMIEDPNTDLITVEAMTHAATLIRWYITEALRLQIGYRVDPALLRSKQLLDWMMAQPQDEWPVRDLMRLGPNSLRTKDVIDAALAVLIVHGWVKAVSDRPRVIRLIRAAVQ